MWLMRSSVSGQASDHEMFNAKVGHFYHLESWWILTRCGCNLKNNNNKSLVYWTHQGWNKTFQSTFKICVQKTKSNCCTSNFRSVHSCSRQDPWPYSTDLHNIVHHPLTWHVVVNVGSLRNVRFHHQWHVFHRKLTGSSCSRWWLSVWCDALNASTSVIIIIIVAVWNWFNKLVDAVWWARFDKIRWRAQLKLAGYFWCNYRERK